MSEPVFSIRLLYSSDDSQLYRFIVFVVCYLLLLGCCCIPIICAYRRNQQLSLMIQDAHQRQMAAIGAFHLSYFDSISDALTQASRERKERRIRHAITATTMMVTSDCFLSKEDDQNAQDEIDEESNYENSNFGALQLSGDHANANRPVPAVCIICLCAYEVDDSVTFSSNRDCRHAYHTECISTWIIKEETPLCPCCRQEFCDLSEEVP